MAAVLPGMAILMFGMIAVYGWMIFSEPRPPPPAKPKVVRRRRRR
jgi:hypothetical protein